MDLLIQRSDITQTRFVTSEDVLLQDGQALAQVEKFALSANNLSYAVLGDKMQFWDFFPRGRGKTSCGGASSSSTSSSTGAYCSASSTDTHMTSEVEQVEQQLALHFGRLPVWGFATVVASRSPFLRRGTRLFGMWPTSSFLVLQPEELADNVAMKRSRSSLVVVPELVFAENRHNFPLSPSTGGNGVRGKHQPHQPSAIVPVGHYQDHAQTNGRQRTLLELDPGADQQQSPGSSWRRQYFFMLQQEQLLQHGETMLKNSSPSGRIAVANSMQSPSTVMSRAVHENPFHQHTTNAHDQGSVASRRSAAFGGPLYHNRKSTAGLTFKRGSELVIDEHPSRRHVLPLVYRSYRVCDPGTWPNLYSRATEDLLMLLQPLFPTAFFLEDWLRWHDFFDADTLVITSASCKSALCFLMVLQEQRKREASLPLEARRPLFGGGTRGGGAGQVRPLKIIAVTSGANYRFVERFLKANFPKPKGKTRPNAVSSEVLLYDDYRFLHKLPPTQQGAVLLDFAGNPETVKKVHVRYHSFLTKSVSVGDTHRLGRLSFSVDNTLLQQQESQVATPSRGQGGMMKNMNSPSATASRQQQKNPFTRFFAPAWIQERQRLVDAFEASGEALSLYDSLETLFLKILTRFEAEVVETYVQIGSHEIQDGYAEILQAVQQCPNSCFVFNMLNEADVVAPSNDALVALGMNAGNSDSGKKRPGRRSAEKEVNSKASAPNKKCKTLTTYKQTRSGSAGGGQGSSRAMCCRKCCCFC
ncbi:unnamed protein product [Amoebophrya sp. A120]|nr:unnamed protein product [Amoebophrya sp. A120]|eukprot:GSA120T00006291001.1